MSTMPAAWGWSREGEHSRRAEPRDHSQGAGGVNQPDPPRRGRMRSGDGRRRGDPDPDSARVLQAGVRQAGDAVGRARKLWRGHGVSAGGQAQPAAVRRGAGADQPGRGPEAAGLARYAGEWRSDRATGARVAAVHRADVRGPSGGDERGRLRAAAVHRAPPHGERDCAVGDRAQGGLLHSVALLPHDRLQGPDAGAAD